MVGAILRLSVPQTTACAQAGVNTRSLAHERDARQQPPRRRWPCQQGHTLCMLSRIWAVDGTTIAFAYAPSVESWCFLDRHKPCSVNVLVSCDWDVRITVVVQCFTGAVPATVVQAAAPWHINPERYFFPGQCRFGDKGMLGSVRVLLTCEGPAAYIRGNRNYDYQHARRRISAEKVMSVLKGRFSSLEELRAPVASDADVTRIMEWVAVCATLQNVCIRRGDTYAELTADAADAADAAPGSAVPLPAAESAARSQMYQHVLQYMIFHGHYCW